MFLSENTSSVCAVPHGPGHHGHELPGPPHNGQVCAGAHRHEPLLEGARLLSHPTIHPMLPTSCVITQDCTGTSARTPCQHTCQPHGVIWIRAVSCIDNQGSRGNRRTCTRTVPAVHCIPAQVTWVAMPPLDACISRVSEARAHAWLFRWEPTRRRQM